MISNYLKVAWRNLLKNKTFSFINIAGLAIGLSCFMLIGLYVIDEVSFDRHHEKADRIYRINSDIKLGDTEMALAVSSDPMGAALKKDYPQVEQYTRIYTSDGSKLIKKGNEFINEKKVCYADSTVFEIFTLPVVAGDIKTSLDKPNSVVITESSARKYFGNTDAVGKTLTVGTSSRTIYNVTAVIKDMPVNGHFNFEFIFSMDNVNYTFGNFLSHNFHTYLLLREHVDYKEFEKNFVSFSEKYILPQAKQFMQINSMKEFEKSGNRLSYSLIPIKDIHLKSDRLVELSANGNIQYVYIFSAVAIFILLIACINFMNLSTARSANRSKEVGIRKVLGTERGTLIRQFIAESAFMSYLSFLIALVITWLAIPYFNDISAKQFSLLNLLKPQIFPFLILLPLIVGILAGYYPAFFLSSFRPIEVLKSKITTGFRKSSLRNLLVTFQFVTSIVLVIGTIVIYQQLNYIQTKKVGFDKDQMLVIENTGALQGGAESFKNEVVKMAGVKSGSFAGYLPVSNSSRSDYTFSKDPVMDIKNGFNMQVWGVDYDYVQNMQMEMAKGRSFSRSFGADSNKIVINETAAKILGYKDPIGKKLYNTGNDNVTAVYEIIGVVKNFHFESLRKNVGPLSLRLGNSSWEMAFRINSADIPGLISAIEKKWKTQAPEMPFSYKFLDDSFDEMYRAEQRVGKVALTFAFLTIFIACLGLFGLVTYVAEQRTKEIGIRKVLGASVFSITSLLSKDFLKLVLIAIVIASPIAYFAMQFWLRDFAYKIDISLWMFIGVGVFSVLIAFLTISFQSIKAALMDPVKSLKSE